MGQGKKYATNAANSVLKDITHERDKIMGKKKDKGGPLKKKDDPVDGAVRVAASVVGFVSEAVQHRRERKVSENNDSTENSVETSDHQVIITDSNNHGIIGNENHNKSDSGSSDSSNRNHGNSRIIDGEAPPQDFPIETVTTPEQANEDIWNRDDTVRRTDTSGSTTAHKTESDEKKSKEPKDLANAFISRHPRPLTVPTTRTNIELPMVLPQRRPKTRARGFVRAYSPVLAAAGIDQDTFLDFIDTFNKALEPNPYLNAINLAGLAGLAAPEPFTLVVGVAVSLVTDATIEAQSRSKSGKFLDFINKEFFTPRGLTCLVVTWSPNTDDPSQVLVTSGFDGRTANTPSQQGLKQQVADVMLSKSATDEIIKRLGRHVQGRMQASNGAFDWPEPAPLVFPSAEDTAMALRTHSNGKTKNVADRAEIWLYDFMDRRAQAKWIEKNPTLPVANSLPLPEFRSRYADPNHPAASGDIISFVTGGCWSTQGKLDANEMKMRQLDDEPKRLDREREKANEAEKMNKNKRTSSVGGFTSFMQTVGRPFYNYTSEC